MTDATQPPTSSETEVIPLRPGQRERLQELKMQQEKLLFKLGVLTRERHDLDAAVTRVHADIGSLQENYGKLVHEFAAEHKIDISTGLPAPAGKRWAYSDRDASFKLVQDQAVMPVTVDTTAKQA